MATSELVKGLLIDDLQNQVDFSYLGWSPSVLVWRAGEGHERTLPYIAVDFIETSDKRFPSFADIVGRIDDKRYEYAFCETEVVTITVYAKKYHNNDTIRGRSYAFEILDRIRKKRILAQWSDSILYNYNHSVDRSRGVPIRDLTVFDTETATRIHEIELTVFLRTDVRWYKELPQGQEASERAESAYVLLQNKNNIRINTS